MNTFNIKIEKILSDGRALAHRKDGKVIFVSSVLPEEEVEVEQILEKKDFVVAKLKKVIQPSSERREPLCEHFGICGGCVFQHCSYQYQLKIKEKIVTEALKNKEFSVNIKIIPSKAEWNTRNTALFHIKDGKPCFFKASSHNPVVLNDCPVLEDGILEKAIKLSKELKDGSSLKVRKDNQGNIISSIDKEKHNLFEFNNFKFKVWIKNFFQCNTSLISVWLREIEENLELNPDDEILDLYSGTGIISIFIAQKVSNVTGIEIDRSAVKRAIINSTVNGLDKKTYFFAGPVEKMINYIKKTDAIILNPPREGANMDTILPKISELNPSRIVYSSCNFSTFIRDLTSFVKIGYKLCNITILDMFPQTSHFEVIARLKKI